MVELPSQSLVPLMPLLRDSLRAWWGGQDSKPHCSAAVLGQRPIGSNPADNKIPRFGFAGGVRQPCQQGEDKCWVLSISRPSPTEQDQTLLDSSLCRAA